MTELKAGLYFGLDDEIYHSLPYLSASAIKNILISPMYFWVWSHMNPMKPERESDAMELGKAYHKRILEGREAFYDNYIESFDPSVHENLYFTNDQIADELKRRGLPVSGRKQDLIDRLRLYNPEAITYDEAYEQWRQNEGFGKIELPRLLLDRIEIAAAMIEKDPNLKKCFTGGYPEVSVIWEEDGITYKSRFDYLKPRAIVDLKSYANTMNKKPDSAIYYAMAQRKYHIQAAFYMAYAAPAAVRAAQEGRVYGCHDKEYLSRLAQTKEHDFYFVFQQTGYVPITRGKKFPRDMMYGCGMQAIEDAIKEYKRCLGLYGTTPWVDTAPIEEFDDSHFPVFATDL